VRIERVMSPGVRLDEPASLPCSLRARQLWEVVTSSPGGSVPRTMRPRWRSRASAHQFGCSTRGRDLDDRTALPCSLRARQLWEVVTSSRVGSAPRVMRPRWRRRALAHQFEFSTPRTPGARPGRPHRAALFAARKAAVGGRDVVARREHLDDVRFGGVRSEGANEIIDRLVLLER
jgi:hypothetical protein